MPNRYAVASGNFNATSTWATTAAGSPGASVPVSGDVAIANNRTVTITANATCTEIRNDNFSGATAGGGFVLNDGVTLTANVIGGSVSASRCVTYQGTTSAEIVGDCTGGSGSFAVPNQTVAVYHNGTGTLTVTGTNHAGGSGQYGAAFLTNASGTLTISGNINPAASSSNGRTIMHGGSGVINVQGNVTSHASSGNTSPTITGASAIPFTATLNVTGSITASANNAVAIGAGTMTVIGTCTANNGFAAIESSSNSATIRASGSFISSADGTLPIYARKFILNTTPTAARTRYALNGSGTYVDMFTADNNLGQANPTDVRSGVSYASGSLTGTCVVPAAGSVALGVPVGNTTGTAILTQADVQAALTAQGLTTARAGNLDNLDTTISSRLAPSGTLATVTNLTNAPASVTPADIWSHATRTLTSASGPTAAQIRTEIDSNSTQLAAIKAKTDLLNTDRLAQCSTVSTTGAQLAAALS